MYKYKLYCISFTAMWLLLFIKTIKLPMYFGHDWCFADLDVIFSIANIVAYASMILLILSIYYIYQLYHMKLGAPCSLPIQIKYLQLIIPQYFISNKSGIWSLSLIVHSKG